MAASPELSTILATGAISIILLVIIASIVILVNSLILWGLSKGFKLKNRKYKTALLTAAVAYVTNVTIGFAIGYFIPNPLTAAIETVVGVIITFVINFAAIKLFYKLKIGKSSLISLILTAALLVIGIVAGIILVLLYTKGSIV